MGGVYVAWAKPTLDFIPNKGIPMVFKRSQLNIWEKIKARGGRVCVPCLESGWRAGIVRAVPRQSGGISIASAYLRQHHVVLVLRSHRWVVTAPAGERAICYRLPPN